METSFAFESNATIGYPNDSVRTPLLTHCFLAMTFFAVDNSQVAVQFRLLNFVKEDGTFPRITWYAEFAGLNLALVMQYSCFSPGKVIGRV